MLTDLPTPAVRYAALLNTAMRRVMGDKRTPYRPMVDWRRTDVGIYEQSGFDDLPWLVQWPHEKDLGKIADVDERLAQLARQGYRSDFGSADTIEQVLALYPDMVTSDRRYLLTFRTLTPTTEPDWRWHKNGPYIGTRDPQHEHLGDETDIDRIITWEVWEVRSREPKVSKLGGMWRPELATWLQARMAGDVTAQLAPLD